MHFTPKPNKQDLPHVMFLRIYKSFFIPNLDYGDINYDKPNKSFKNKIENIQCKICIAITVAIQGTSCECLYQELGLESLENKHWY